MTARSEHKEENTTLYLITGPTVQKCW